MCESPPAIGQGTQFYSGSVCESNTPVTSLPHSGFEVRSVSVENKCDLTVIGRYFFRQRINSTLTSRRRLKK